VRYIEAHAAPLPKDLKAAPEEPPGALFHYTSGQGLVGILASGELHCTNLLYMNDASEMDYGRAVVLEAGRDLRSSVPELLQPFFDRILDSLDKPDFHYYVTCFCEKPDLLSQWRAYGAQAAGYSIGFDAEDMQAVLPEYSELVRVLYDPQEQYRATRALLRAYLAPAEECVAAFRGHERLEDSMIRWTAIASNGMGRLIARMKSAAFAEEHEWRAIVMRFSFDTGEVRFRLAPNGIVVPYHAWLFKRKGYKAVRQVQHGPTVNGALAVRSLGMLLHNLGYRDVGIKGSAIPLRV
jgi:hypothetical protein